MPRRLRYYASLLEIGDEPKVASVLRDAADDIEKNEKTIEDLLRSYEFLWMIYSNLRSRHEELQQTLQTATMEEVK